MGNNKLGADFELLFHPDLKLSVNEIAMWYSVDSGKTWDDYYANKLSSHKYNIRMFDLPEGKTMEFYVEVALKDGRVMRVTKDGNNYKVKLVDKGDSMYKAQVRIKDMSFAYRKCLICESKIDGIQCQTPECEATYCPICNRMLAPHSNYCPWDNKIIAD